MGLLLSSLQMDRPVERMLADLTDLSSLFSSNPQPCLSHRCICPASASVASAFYPEQDSVLSL